MDDELLDLVNEHDEKIGTINRNEYDRLLSEKLGYVRAIDVFIINSKGQLFIPTRTADKTIAPNGLDYSVGGHVSAGEDYITTVIREAKEELNIKVKESDLTFIAKVATAANRYIRGVYIMYSDDTPDFNPKDFVSAEWLYPEEVIAKIDGGHPAKQSIKETLIMLQTYLESSRKN